MLGLAQQAGHELTAQARRRRRARRQHLRVHRQGQAGIDRHDSRARRAQEERAVHEAGGDRLSGRALPRRAQGRNPRNRRRARNGRSSAHRRGPRAAAPAAGSAPSAVPLQLFRGRKQALAQTPAVDLPIYRQDDISANEAVSAHISARHREPRPASCRAISTTPTRPRVLTTPRHVAYVKIAEGCDYNCAFCIIPKLRGPVPQPLGRIDRGRGARSSPTAASASCS